MKNVLIFTILMLIGSPALADESGFYFGGSIGSASIGPVQSTSIAFKGFIGHRSSENFAIEVHSASLGNYYYANASSVGTSVVGIIPVNDDLEIMGKVGYHFWKANGNVFAAYGYDFTGGIGAQYSVTDNAAIRVEYEYFSARTADFGNLGASLFSVGAVYKF